VKHVRILGLALAAVFVMAAIAAAGASASSPEWGECVAKAGGKYLDANCQTKGKGGSFEWKKGASLPNHKFTGHSVGSGGVLTSGIYVCEEEQPVGSGKSGPNFFKRLPRADCHNGLTNSHSEAGAVECASEENSGEAVGKDKIENVAVTFKGCLFLGQLPCQSAGAAEGEVKTNALTGELGYINKAAHEVGVRLTPATKHGRFTQFHCTGGEINQIEIGVGAGNSKEGAAYLPESKGGEDAIISPITPVNAMTSEFTQVYTENKETEENIPSRFEGKKTSLLEMYLEQQAGGAHESWDWTPAGEEITNVNTPEVPGEIKG
jgi:hypothetical protein